MTLSLREYLRHGELVASTVGSRQGRSLHRPGCPLRRQCRGRCLAPGVASGQSAAAQLPPSPLLPSLNAALCSSGQPSPQQGPQRGGPDEAELLQQMLAQPRSPAAERLEGATGASSTQAAGSGGGGSSVSGRPPYDPRIVRLARQLVQGLPRGPPHLRALLAEAELTGPEVRQLLSCLGRSDALDIGLAVFR